MTVTIKQQTSEAPYQRDKPPYDVLVDGEKISRMIVSYPNDPSIWAGEHGIISSLSFRSLDTKQIIGLLTIHDSVLPDKRQVGVVFHAQALWNIESLASGIDQSWEGFSSSDLTPTCVEVYGKVKDALTNAHRQISAGEQDYDGAVQNLRLAAKEIKEANDAVKEELGEHSYDYLSAELGRNPLNVERQITKIANGLEAAGKVFDGKDQELVQGLSGQQI